MLTSVTKNLLQNCSADAAEQTDGADQWLAIYLKCHSLTAVCLCSVTCHSTYLCCGLYCPSLPFQLLPCLFTPQYQSTYPHKPNPLAAANFTPLPFRWLFGKKKSPCFPTPPPFSDPHLPEAGSRLFLLPLPPAAAANRSVRMERGRVAGKTCLPAPFHS